MSSWGEINVQIGLLRLDQHAEELVPGFGADDWRVEWDARRFQVA